MRNVILVMLCGIFLFASHRLSALDLSETEGLDRPMESAEEAQNVVDALVAGAQHAFESLSPKNCKELADKFGKIISELDRLSPSIQQLQSLRDRSAEMSVLCRKKIRSIEDQHRNDEAALEAFYRSRNWYLLNGAFSTIRYWQAWIDLSLAKQPVEPKERLRLLSSSERAFQQSALRIHYPSIVYGSWMGMARVAIERGVYEEAERRLLLLDQAISANNFPSLQESIDAERRFLEILKGRDSALGPVGGKLSTAEARQLLNEAFILLERQRKEGTGGILAAERVKSVLQSDYLDDQILSQLQGYREEIAGRDIGPIARLIEMEYAFDYEKYNTVVLKYREFLPYLRRYSELNLSGYQYHYAVALYQIELYEDALLAVRKLLKDEGSTSDLLPSLLKLQFASAAKLYSYRADTQSKEAYIASARDLLDRFPASAAKDKVLAQGWTVLAKFEADELLSREYFTRAEGLAGGDSEAIVVSRYARLGERFDQAYLANDSSGLEALAEEGLRTYLALPSSQRKRHALRALKLQFESLVAGDVEQLSRSIDALAKECADEESIQRRLFRARLLLHSRERLGLVRFVADSLANDSRYWKQDEAYKLVLAKDISGDLDGMAELASSLMSMYVDRPDQHRYLKLVQIRSYMHSGKHEQAFHYATDMLANFPESGDAWTIYAETAELNGSYFEADRAWARISSAAAKGSPRWLNASLKRVDLQTYEGSGNPCEVLNSAATYVSNMDAAQYAASVKLNRQYACQNNKLEGI